MGLCFSESLKKYQEENSTTPDTDTPDTGGPEEDSPVTPPEEVTDIYEGLGVIDTEAEWSPVLDQDYKFYDDYSGDDVSAVTAGKKIVMKPGQVNFAQESNSQYVPFQMPRYFDGYDMGKTKIQFYFVNEQGHYGIDRAVNVYTSEDKIRFAWLVSNAVTRIGGEIKFEIQAIGQNSNGDLYVWKTYPNSEISIAEALAASVYIEPDDNWQESFMAVIDEKLLIAQEAAESAMGYADESKKAAEEAIADIEDAKTQSYADIKDLKESALSDIETSKSDVIYIAEKVTKDLEELSGNIGTLVEEIYDERATETINEKVAAAMGNYYTKSEVDQIIENIDISEQLDEVRKEIENLDGLANFNVEYDGAKMTFYNGETVMKEIEIASDPTEEWTQAYTTTIDQKISDVSSTLTGNFNERIEDLNETYATKEVVQGISNDVSTNKAGILSNKEGVSALNVKLLEIENVIEDVDTSPRLTYDVVYNDMEDENSGENKFVLYEIEREGTEDEVRTPKRVYTITGGSGGSMSSNTLYINYEVDPNGNKRSTYVFTIENVEKDEAFIRCEFYGLDSSGDSVSYANGTWQFRRGTSGQWLNVATDTLYPSKTVEFNISNYVTTASAYQFRLIAQDDSGAYTSKTWTVDLIDLKLASSFNDRLTYPIGPVVFDYTPYGSITKDIHFVLDGVEIKTITTTSSGLANPIPLEIPAQTHGSHLLDAYITANINGILVESNHISKDIIWYDESSDIPVIGCVYRDITAVQHNTTNIVYTVYDPSTDFPVVTLYEDGEIVSTLTLENNTDTWQYKSSEIGDHVLTISCRGVEKTLKATIEELDIDLEPVVAGLVFDFNPVGKSNNDTDRLWSDGDISMSVSDNFDWINGGYQMDDNGDRYFCVKAGTSAVINYNMFADDAKRYGKEFKIVFKSTNVQNTEAAFLSCVDNTTNTDHVGIVMNVHDAHIYGGAGVLDLSYSENDIIEFEFNISTNQEAIPMVMGYEDGVSTRPMVYDDSFNFTQITPKPITIGSESCDLHIYRMKAYNSSLNARGILNNFIADARNAEEMVARYNRNQIYDNNNMLTPETLAEQCPWLRVYKVSAPYFTNNKSDKVPGTTIQQIYKNGDPVLDNWTCYNCMHSGQGTSSNNYGAAGRNLDFIMNKSGVDGVNPSFILGDGTETNKITATRTSVPVDYLNVKVNIASSNNMTNAMLANRYNKFNPYRRPFIRIADLTDVYSEEEISAMTENERSAALAELQVKVDAEKSYIKDTMEFHNCVVFIQETNEDVSTHREFSDSEWHFYAIGNVGDSKKTDNTRMTDVDDKYECCVEIMDVELPLSDFPTNTMIDAMGYVIDENTNEKIYTWAKDENLGILHELVDGEYILTTDTTIDLNKTYYVDILEHDDFSEDFTYGWRYIYEDGTDEENAEVARYCHQKWIELYRFITTSTDEEFRAHLRDYFIVDSALYNYLFTTRYCMVDNRAKNTFWHYGKTGELDENGNPIRKWDLCWDYDNDTALGLNNYGAMVYRYGLEDIDVDGNGEEVFRESDSTFFCRIRDLFGAELRTMYNTLESTGAWHAESFLNEADVWQSEFPEELWRVDIERKYIRTYTGSFINGTGDAQFLVNMANGKMKYHRRQWERGQEKYMASKYQSSVASSDNAVLRCANPGENVVVAPNYRLKLTPYDYMYLNVKYGTTSPIQMRAKPNIEYEIPYTGDSADIIDVYSASCIRSLGDLSTCYAVTVDTSKATKLKELVIGNNTDGYDNPGLTTLTLGANALLEVLNVENVSGLTQALNVSALHNLKELYAHGSNTSGVIFAPGGKIQTAELPAIGSITMKNLLYLRELNILSLENVVKAVIENCSTIDVLSFINAAPSLNRVRLTGIDWELDDTSLLERLYKMSGVDKDDYNTERSVIAGKVRVPVIREQQLYDYKKAWPDLEVVFGSMIEQYSVTFVNDNGEILEVQYVDKGEGAVDPSTRAENPLVPTKESSVSHDFTFIGWDSSLDTVFSDRIVTALYSEALRTYTIKYVSNGITMQESTGLYGENIPYTGVSPTYTAEEVSFTYHLFNRWDKSGVIDGNKTVNALFDRFMYTDGAFDGKKLSDMSPVEIYALTKLNDSGNINIQDIISDKDAFEFMLGKDIDYDDIDSVTLISDQVLFDGTNYIDTGIRLFEEDRDFVLAIDYEFLEGNAVNSVLAQCFQTNGTNGFKLWYGSSNSFNGAKLSWGTASDNVVASSKREVIVIRHKKGDNNLTVYKSNLDGENVISTTLTRTKETICDSVLVFGASNPEEGYYENHALGNIYWAKLWYTDLGEDVCQNLAAWTHESIELEACGFRRYYLSENPSKRCSFSLLASHLLSRTKKWNQTSTNAGGWAESSLNKSLNGRLYNAMPDQIRSLIKKVTVYSSVGQGSSDLSSSDCYITVPALIEVDPTYTSEPYIGEGTPISYMNFNESRKRAFAEGDYFAYWLRSPNVGYSTWVWRVDENGQTNSTQGITNATSSLGVLIELSI